MFSVELVRMIQLIRLLPDLGKVNRLADRKELGKWPAVQATDWAPSEEASDNRWTLQNQAKMGETDQKKGPQAMLGSKRISVNSNAGQ